MYVVSLMFSSGQRQVNLIFDSGGQAILAFAQYVGDRDKDVTDDEYGTRVLVFHDRGPLDAVMLQDVAAARRGAVEMAALNARAQAAAQSRAAAGPALRFAGLSGSGVLQIPRE